MERLELQFLLEVKENINSSSKVRGLCHHFGNVCDGKKYSLELLDKYLDAMPSKPKYSRYGDSEGEKLFKFPYGEGKNDRERFYHHRVIWLDNKIEELKKTSLAERVV